MVEDVDVGTQLFALADPTRRSIYELLRRRPSSVRELTDQIPVSQPAVSQHLRILGGADLVTVRQAGTRRIYRIDPKGVESLRNWIDDLWDDVLDSFVDAAERVEAAEKEAIS